MPDDVIQRMMDEHHQLVGHLPSDEVSLQSRVEIAFGKALALSVASNFESRVTQSVADLFHDNTGSEALVAFVKSKAIARRYHDWFNWDAKNANQFFSAFGPGFKDFMANKCHKDATLDASVRAFIELGDLRNRLVHENYAQFSMDKTVGEIFDLYKRAEMFVSSFREAMDAYIETEKNP